LDFRRIKLQKWNDLVACAQDEDPDSIIRLAPFAGDSKARVEIKKNQKLWVLAGKKGKPLMAPLEPLGPGERYELMIEHLDDTKPLSFAECIGFAHHCRSLRLDRSKEPIFCIFRPKINRDEGNSTATSTESGICISARIGSAST
jgi:hypothetical protein